MLVDDESDGLPEDDSLDMLPLREAALDLARDSREGRALKAKLEAFDRLDNARKKLAAAEIRHDIANIIARAVTEEHQRRQLLDALATYRNSQAPAVATPSDVEDQPRVVADLVDVAKDILAALGKEMLIEAVLPGAHLLTPPTDLMDSILTAVQMINIARHPVDPPFATWP